MEPNEALAGLAAGRYAFIDLGSGTGGSIEHCVRRFGLSPGLGFELGSDDATAAGEAGFHVVEYDVRSLKPPSGTVGFVSAMDFLEHLPDLQTAEAVLRNVTPAARDFLFIRHPSFEDIDYLAQLGLKQCWTDWAEHPNMMLVEDIEGIFRRFGWTEYAVFPRAIAVDATDDQIVPLSAPRDTQIYDAEGHGPKPAVVFDRPVFAQFDIFVRIGNHLTDDDWRRILLAGLEDDAQIWPARLVSRTSAPAIQPLDLGFYDSSEARWSIRSSDGSIASFAYGAKGLGWRAFTGDFDGDGSIGVGVYDPASGSFFLRNTPGEGEADATIGFGAPDGIAIAGDWTGTGTETIGVYAPQTGQWFLRYENSSGPADDSFSFGAAAGDLLPIVGDWDGDGCDSVGLYDPATGSWHLRRSHTRGREDLSFTFGPPRAMPVAGDWTGCGRDSIGVYVPDWGLWLLRNENSNGGADATIRHRGAGWPVVARIGR